MSGDFLSLQFPEAPSPPSRKGFLVFALALPIALFALAIWFGTETRSVEAGRLMVRESYARRLAATQLMLDLVTGETAERGFLLTGDRAFLAPYDPVRRKLAGEIAHLDLAYADAPEQRDRLDRLQFLIAAKFRRMDVAIVRRDQGNPAAAIAIVSDGRGRALMARIRAVVADLSATEDRRLAGGLAALRDKNMLTVRLVWALVLLGGFTLLVGLALLWQGRQARYRLQRGMQEALARLRALFASTTDAILILDPDGGIEAMNAAAGRMSGYAADELEHSDVSRLIEAGGDKRRFHDRIGLVGDRLQHASWLDRTLRTRSGDAVPVDIAFGLMPLPDGVRVVATIHDISERKGMERLKDDFIATVSHELRTPLTSVVGSLGLLRGGSVGRLPDAARRLVDIAENNSRRLIRLINDILDIEKIGTGQMHFESDPLDLVRLAMSATEASRGLAQARDVVLATAMLTPAPMVRGDHDRIVQVMSNLLSNAIRYSPAEGRVIVSAGVEGECAIVSIEDEGSGIPAEFESRMFTRFAQAADCAGGGTGLGLAISREIVEAHGGRIGFTRPAGGGSRFFFTLPLAQPQSDADSSSRHHCRILLCEDDAEMAQVIRLLMETEGCTVDRVTTSAEAELAAQSGRYDVIVLDLQLSDASGLEAVRALRQRAETRQVPIIVVSATASDRRADPASTALEVVDWIDKPVDSPRLMQAVRQAIRHASANRPILLHVDDDEDMLEVTATGLADQGRVIRATSLAAARTVLAQEAVDVVILDLSLADGSGLDLVPELVDGDGNAIPTIIYSAQDTMPDIRDRVDAVLVKSRRSLPNLASTIRRLLADVAA